MTIENKENNTTWIEIKKISSLSYPQKSNDYFTLSFNDWDNKIYVVNFDPYEFLNWVDNKTLKELKKYIIKELNNKTK